MDEKKTTFDIEENAGDWFTFFNSTVDETTGKITYDDPEPDAGRVCIRSADPFVKDRMRSREKKHQFVPNPKTRAMEQVEVDNKTAEQDMTELEDAFDYAITDFENLFDGKGEPIKVTKENKIKLIAIPVFDRFVARCFEIQRDNKASKEKAIEKNLSTP